MRFPRDRRSIRALSSKRSATRHRSAERGQILIIFALSLIAILAMAGLLIDGGRAWGDKRQAQTAADTAALNAAKAFAAQPDDASLTDRITAATAAAKFISDKNGFPAGTVRCPGGAWQEGVTVNAGFAHVTIPPVANQTYIEVTVSRPMQTTLAGVIGQSCWMVSSRAVASVAGAVSIAEYPAIFAFLGPNPCLPYALTSTGDDFTVVGKVISNSGIKFSNLNWHHTSGTTTQVANPPNTCGSTGPVPPDTTTVTVKTEFPVTYSFCYPGPAPADAPPPDCVGHLPWTITNNMTGVTKACTYKSGSGSNDFDVAHLAFALGPGVYCSSTTLKVTGTPASTDLAGVAFGGGQWVSVGPGGALATSPDGISWTKQTSSFGSTDITAAAYGSGQWVTVGNGGKLATSPDGVTWTQRTSSFPTTDIITGVAFANGQWVAVANGGKLATSPDGVTWTQRTSGFTTNITGVAFGHGQWMVVGASSQVSTSVDGIAWTPRTTGFGGNIAGVAYNGSDLWVVVGQNGKRATSSNDGVTWTAPITSFGGVTMAGVAFGSGQWVAFGPSGTLYTSTNGTAWSLVTATGFGTNDIAEVAYNGTNLWVAVGQGGRITTSPDGVTWTSRSSDFSSTAATMVSAGKFDTSVELHLRSYWDDLLIFTTSTLSDKAIHISSPGGEWQGLIYAPNGEVDFTGSAGSFYQSAMWGRTVTMTGSKFTLDSTGLGTATGGPNHYTIGNLVE
jgi:Flp pilus assembly protein TadG